jgi:hypothetical protein
MGASLESVVGRAKQAPSAAAPSSAPAPSEAPAAETSQQTEGAPAGGEVAEPKGADVSAPPAPAQTTAPVADDIDALDEGDPHPVPRKVAIAERKKRQAAEQEAAELRGQLKVLQEHATRGAPQQDPQKPGQPQVSDADLFFADPPAYIERRLAETSGKQRLELSQELMRSVHTDYDDVEKAFLEAAANNPGLQIGLAKASNPARFAYENGKALAKFKGVGSIEELTAKIEAEVTEKLEEKYRKQNAVQAATNVSQSSVGARGSGANSTPVFTRTPLHKVARGVGV